MEKIDMLNADDGSVPLLRLVWNTALAAVIGSTLGAAGMTYLALLQSGPSSPKNIVSGISFMPIIATIGLYMSLPATILLGTPAAALLKRRGVSGWRRITIFALLGALSGPIAWTVMSGTEAVGSDLTASILFGLMCGLACDWTTRRFGAPGRLQTTVI